jgi:hypothetical protein
MADICEKTLYVGRQKDDYFTYDNKTPYERAEEDPELLLISFVNSYIGGIFNNNKNSINNNEV